ncbi:MAG: hypothetical protein KA603_16045 [Azonexus sp.]|nr:hypothetical protein [Betaproteobacteria bacterium]MBK7900063.1 hypothetical protein [Betaproteobacteria bacterium]MBK8919431.1 hypothetical protein [Betaproteobacteria bacterium]MBP6037635.1 hypothetical protein [Azonexus sp.]MBP6907888.1 hypothetical protein [Azonexus sp.]
MRRPLCLALLALVAAAPSRADDVADARSFITDLYRAYESAGERPRRGDPRWYDESLARLLTENQQANAGGVPLLSGDPLCNCMDATGMRLEEVVAAALPEGRVGGEARLALGAERRERIRLILVRTGAGLRVWDVGDEQTPSLRQALEDDTASAQRDKVESGRK